MFGVGVAGGRLAPATWQTVSLWNDATDGSQIEVWQIQPFADNAIIQSFYRQQGQPNGSLVPGACRTVNPIASPGWGQIWVETGGAQITDQPIFAIVAGFLNSQIIPNFPICILAAGERLVTQGDATSPETMMSVWYFSV